MTSPREKLIWKLAEAAWEAHYCAYRGDYTLCDQCRDDGKCFELGGGFWAKDYDRTDWERGAEAMLEKIEDEYGITFDLHAQRSPAGASPINPREAP
jgi:hypothetical protein